MSRKVHRDVAEVWRERLERQSHGKYSVAEFCRREGVSQPSFYHWRKRLGGLRRRQRGTPKARPASKPQFLPVEVPSSLLTTGVRIELPGGAVVRLPQDVSVEIVTAAVQAACVTNSKREGK